MKIVLIVIGALGGLYALFGIIQLVNAIGSSPVTAYGGSNIAASVVPVCLGLIVCVVCFQRAFRKPKQ